jgi:hypothetical protein
MWKGKEILAGNVLACEPFDPAVQKSAFVKKVVKGYGLKVCVVMI